jgi:transcriptional regulator with XRE-family HTH domain
MSASIGEILATRLREARGRHGWTQREVSERTGICQPMISQFESGKVLGRTLSHMVSLADNLGVSVDYLLGRENL